MDRSQRNIQHTPDVTAGMMGRRPSSRDHNAERGEDKVIDDPMASIREENRMAAASRVADAKKDMHAETVVSIDTDENSLTLNGTFGAVPKEQRK